jgi:hypothetical protein
MLTIYSLEIYQVLRLINSFISFNIQTVVSAVIRLKELKATGYTLPTTIANWPSFLQNGVDSQLKLDLIEMGLIDRVAVLGLANYFTSVDFVYEDYKSLRAYLIQNGDQIIESQKDKLPTISFEKVEIFIRRLYIRTLR